MEWWHIIQNWALHLGDKYHVNPLVFVVIYIGAIPFFFASLGWLVKSIKQKKSVVLPLLLSGFFFVSAYLYLIIVGENIPAWVYWAIGILVAYGIFSAVKKIQKKLKLNKDK